MSEYQAIRSSEIDTLNKKCAAMLAAGWKPLGGVSVAHAISPGGENRYSYAQAFTREGPPVPNLPRPPLSGTRLTEGQKAVIRKQHYPTGDAP